MNESEVGRAEGNRRIGVLWTWLKAFEEFTPQIQCALFRKEPEDSRDGEVGIVLLRTADNARAAVTIAGSIADGGSSAEGGALLK